MTALERIRAARRYELLLLFLKEKRGWTAEDHREYECFRRETEQAALVASGRAERLAWQRRELLHMIDPTGFPPPDYPSLRRREKKAPSRRQKLEKLAAQIRCASGVELPALQRQMAELLGS